MIALYYGLTGVTSAWAYRATLAATGAATFAKRCVLPGIGGLILFAAGLWSLRNDWNVDSSYTSLTLPGGHHVGGVFVIGVLALLLGVVLMALQRRSSPEFFERGLAPLDVDTDHTGGTP